MLNQKWLLHLDNLYEVLCPDMGFKMFIFAAFFENSLTFFKKWKNINNRFHCLLIRETANRMHLRTKVEFAVLRLRQSMPIKVAFFIVIFIDRWACLYWKRYERMNFLAKASFTTFFKIWQRALLGCFKKIFFLSEHSDIFTNKFVNINPWQIKCEYWFNFNSSSYLPFCLNELSLE